MPLKKKSTKLTSAKVVEGNPIQTPDNGLMSLFKPAMLPAVTLNAEQFAFPETFLVMGSKRIENYEKNPATGWDLKDEHGNKTGLGTYSVRLTLADGDAAQKLVDAGLMLDGLTSITAILKKDVPLQKFVPGETLIKLVKPVVMLGFGGQQADRIELVAEDYKEV